MFQPISTIPLYQDVAGCKGNVTPRLLYLREYNSKNYWCFFGDGGNEHAFLAT